MANDTLNDGDADDDFDHETFVETLVKKMASTTGTASRLNLISLVTAGLMSWETEIGYEQARIEAAALVLQGVTGIMLAITELTLLDGNASN